MKEPICCGVLDTEKARIVSSSVKRHGLSSRLLARQLNELAGKTEHGYTNQRFKSFELYSSFPLKHELIKPLLKEYNTYTAFKAKELYIKYLDEATQKLDIIEQGINQVLFDNGGEIDFYYTGDSHGIDDESIRISVNIAGIEYSREI
jgi:hypothetical protein